MVRVRASIMGRSSRPRVGVDVTFVLVKPSDTLPSTGAGGGAASSHRPIAQRCGKDFRSSVHVNGNVLFRISLVDPAKTC